MPRTRSWNSGRRQQLLTKAVSPNFVAMSQASPNQLEARPFPLLDAINAATGELVANGGTAGFMALPRDPRDDNAFGPMDPLRPEAIDLLDSNGRTEPRLWQYPVGWNLPGNGNRETPWAVLRAAAAGVGIIRRCIEARKKDVSDLAFVFAPSEDAINDAYQKNPAAGRLDAEQKLREELMPEMARLREFWRRPWRTRGWDFKQWCRAALEDVLVVDGVPIYPRRTYGGEVYDLELIVPDTIKPLLDTRGNRPAPPFPAYQQLLYGFPRGEWAATAEYDDDGNAIIRDGFMSSEMMYYVANTRTFSPFGFSPVEQALFDSRLYLQRQKWMLAEYDDGSTPLTWVETAAPTDGQQMTLTQQKLWEKAFNARLAGQTRERHRVKVLPNGWKAMQMASVDERYRPEYDLYLIKLLASHFGVTATRLGFGETNGLGGSGFSESQMAVTGELGLKPDTEVLTAIINEASCHFLSMDKRIVGMFVDPSQSNSPEQAAVQREKIQSGQISINEGRQADGQSLLPFEEANMPFVLGGPQGIIFLDGAKATIEAAMQAQQMAAETQALGTAGKLGLEEKKLEDGKEARKEEHDFQRETREAEAATEVKKAAELVAFRRWRAKPVNAGDEPRRPFLFKSVEPGDGWAELDTLGPAVVDYEGWEWVWDGDIEKAAKKAGKTPFDYLSWNASPEGLKHPKGPNGRWVKRGSDLHQALIAEGERHARATGAPSDAPTSIKPMKTPAKKVKTLPETQHAALVAIAGEVAERAKLRLAGDSNGFQPVLADKQLGLKRATTTALARAGYVERQYNMMGDSVHLTDKGREYVASHGDRESFDAAQAQVDEHASRAAEYREHAAGSTGELRRLDGVLERDAQARQARAALERDAGLAPNAHLYGSHPRPHQDMKPSNRDGQRVEVRANKGTESGTVVGEVGGMRGAGNDFLVVQHDDGTFQTYDSRVVHESISPAEADARARQARIDAVKPKAEFLADVEEGINTGADSATLRRMVEQSVRRNNLADDPVAGHVQLNMDNASLNTAAAAWGLRRIGDEGSFDPALHSPVGDRPRTGGDVELVRPGYVFRDGGEEIQLARAVVDLKVTEPEPSKPKIEPLSAARKSDLRDQRAEQLRERRREQLNATKEPKDNGAKVKALMDGTIDAADLYRKVEAGPSGQRANVHVGRVRFRDNQHGEFQVVDKEGRNAGWMTRVNRNGEEMYIVHSEDYDGGIHLVGWVDSVSLGADVLVNGKHAATGRHDSRRISTGKFEAYVPKTPEQLDREDEARERERLERQAAREAARKPGIDSTGFVTSAMNAHSLRRGDQVVIQGRAASIVAHMREGSVVVIELDDGRVLNLGLNEPVRRVHGGNLRKAADPGMGEGGADPKAPAPNGAVAESLPPPDSRWPGWLMDTLIASAVASLILEMMPGLPIGELLRLYRRLAGTWPTGLPNWREMEPQARRGTVERVAWELRQDGWPNTIAQRIGQAIQNAHVEGAYVGQQVGRAVADATLAGQDITGPALEFSIDWNGWEPGHPEAARLLLEPGGLERLLRESNTVTRLLADARVDQIGRVIGEGLANGDPPKKIGQRLAELFGDRTWADMTALTETNRAMSRASVDQYRDAGMLFKGWMTAFDQRVCPICKLNERWPDGRLRIVPIDENFPSGDPYPPGHPRCRCAPIPILNSMVPTQREA